jgi:hypothetical protein
MAKTPEVQINYRNNSQGTYLHICNSKNKLFIALTYKEFLKIEKKNNPVEGKGQVIWI